MKEELLLLLLLLKAPVEWELHPSQLIINSASQDSRCMRTGLICVKVTDSLAKAHYNSLTPSFLTSSHLSSSSRLSSKPLHLHWLVILSFLRSPFNSCRVGLDLRKRWRRALAVMDENQVQKISSFLPSVLRMCSPTRESLLSAARMITMTMPPPNPMGGFCPIFISFFIFSRTAVSQPFILSDKKQLLISN